MDWIKKNPARFSLLVVSFCAIAATAFLLTKVLTFSANFGQRQTASPPTDKSRAAELDALAAAREALGKPAVWQPAPTSGILLASKLYVLKDEKLVRLDDSSPFQPPVANAWLRKYDLDLLSGSILESDPDNDGFTTLQEWAGDDELSHLDATGQPVAGVNGQPLPDDSANPKDPSSHPPYHTRLRIVGFGNKPFRLLFKAYDVNPNNPKDITAQINPVDRGGRTLFIPLGEDIPGTDFKVDALQRKEIDGKDGTKIDASELMVINKRTGDKVVLPLGKPIMSPDTLIQFKYLWLAPGKPPTPDFEKRKGDTFSLPPEIDKIYKIVDITAGEAVIQLPGGEKKTFKPSK